MVLLKNIPAVLLSIIIIFPAHAEQVNDQTKVQRKQNDVQLLMAFLSQEQPSQEQRQKAQDLINKGQVFFLNYERDEPLKSDSDRKDREALKRNLKEKGVYITGGDHHFEGKIYPRLSARFSKFSTYNNPDPKNWLEQMKLPIDAGYELKSVRIVYLPSMEVKKQTFEKSAEVLSQIVNELQKLKPEFKQLAEFDKAILSAGKWDDGDWPRSYPNFFYRYGYGREIPNTKGLYEKTKENWCYIHIGFAPIRGGLPAARPYGLRGYPSQGIEASWNIESGNEGLNKRITDIIIKSLSILDKYEEELENSQIAYPVAANKMLESLKPLEYWLDSMKDSDRELNKKWDLPEYVLGETSTDKLFLHFITTPMTAMLMIYPTAEVEIGVQRLLNSSSTLHEFYMRQDLAEGALQMYREYDLSPESISDESFIEIYSKHKRIRENPALLKLLGPDNIVEKKIARIAMDIMYADMTMLSPQFFPKLKGHEREFLTVMLERYEKVAELQEIYGEDQFGPALSYVSQFCLSLAENHDEEFYIKLKGIDFARKEWKKQLIEELKHYLGK